ncbi:hypothetical protein [Clostridium sp. BJN0001]|uniref:hypothetical protein n=1 Tax=Clostridium sp. BJN0001 TaxID=2930219 RepID=UPI001FD533A3|nr:hypothetical protein [Clostridium sp. BJN0001]
MSDYIMDINGRIELGDYSSIYDYLNIVESDDNFIIKVHSNSQNNIMIIDSMLIKSNFIVNSKIYDSSGNCYITAKRMYS